jgi:hypothetical protein
LHFEQDKVKKRWKWIVGQFILNNVRVHEEDEERPA